MGAQNPRTERAPVRASDPAFDAVAFTGTADVTLTTHSRAVYIAADGDLKVDMVGYDGNAGAAYRSVPGFGTGRATFAPNSYFSGLRSRSDVIISSQVISP